MRCKPPGSSIGLSVCLLLAVCAGCEDKIALGSECPPFGGECLDRNPRANGDANEGNGGETTPPSGSGSADGDAASPEMPRDGQVALPDDAGVVTPGSVFPTIRNGSLDMTGGSKDGGMLSYLQVQASPWLSCSPPGYGPGAYPTGDLREFPVGTPKPEDTLIPTDGNGLISVSADGTTLAQTLSEPLLAGQRYAFMIDVASTNRTTDMSLEVLGGSSTCFSPEPLAVTPPAEPGVWTSVCISFTPTKNHRSIMLSASSPEASSGSRLFLDNIRADPSCE